MKDLLNITILCRINSISKAQSVSAAWNAQPVVYFIMLLATFLLTTCKKVMLTGQTKSSKQ
ncbi:MAG TPA: hypothetical protein VFU29_24340 [Chitinophagaceae bacterium]|nr:hypothetical protein [Chitinophagaceae bacterium]